MPGWDVLLAGVPLVALYVSTVARDLGTIDSGELAVVAMRLGVAHPTGYPLYSLLARVVSVIGTTRPILALNLLSSVAALLAALFVTRSATQLLSSAATTSPRWLRTGIAALAGIWLGTNRVFWDQATGNEVYALHLLLVAVLLLLGVRLLRERAVARDLVLAAYVFGLGGAHHLSILFLAPAFVFAGISVARARTIGGDGREWRPTMLLALAALLLGASALLYLPIRSAHQPVLDWGDPTTWSRFARHVTAAQYRVWFLESSDLFRANFEGWVRALPDRLGWPLLVLAPIGVFVLTARLWRQLVFLMLVLVTTALWASSYDIHDIAPYYLPADVALALFAAVGLAWLFARLPAGVGRDARPGRHVGPVVLLALALWPAAEHYRGADRSRDHFVRTHAETILRALPPNAVLLSRHWDALVSPALYLQNVEGLRPDVTIVDTELLRRSWYFPQLRRVDPELCRPIEDRIAAFLMELLHFEQGQPYDPAGIEQRYRSVIQGFALSSGRPTFLTFDVLSDYSREVQLEFFAPLLPLPEGLVYALRPEPAHSPALAPPSVDALLGAGYQPRDAIHRQVVDVWGRSLLQRADFLRAVGRSEEALPWEAAARDLERRLAMGADLRREIQ